MPKLSGGVLRMTDRDVLLVRADLRPPAFHLSDVQSRKFDAAYQVSGVPLAIDSGWISAIVHTGNRHFRIVTTHLQSPVLTDPNAPIVQMAQAQDLIHELRNSTVPVILAGDFNSDAIPGRVPVPTTPPPRSSSRLPGTRMSPAPLAPHGPYIRKMRCLRHPFSAIPLPGNGSI
jgi:hypothetical protein